MHFVHDDQADTVQMRQKTALQSLRAQDRTVGKTVTCVGRFEANYTLSPQQHSVLERLVSYYDDEFVEAVLRPIVTQNDSISLRALDWVCTNLSKSQNIVCRDLKGRPFNVHHGYKKALAWYRRRNFDPFRRRTRIVVHSENGDISSTVGQLNYIWFCHVNGVLQYARENGRDIEKHMTRITTESRTRKAADRRAGRVVKRNELTSAPATKLTIYTDDCNIQL